MATRSRRPRSARRAGRERCASTGAGATGVDSLSSGQSVDLSRNALLSWMNSLLQLNLHELIECRDGDVFCQLFDIVFPQSVQLDRVRWEPKTQQHRLHNMRLLQHALERLNIKRDVPMIEIVEGHMKANLELVQWMRMLFRMHYTGEPYHARERRQRCKREQKRRLRESGSGIDAATHHDGVPAYTRDGRGRRRQLSIASPLSSPPILQTEAPCMLVCGSPYEFGACINGNLNTARFLAPSAMASAHRQHLLYVAEFASHTIRCIDLDAGRVYTIAGLAGEYGKHDGEFESARFACPTGLALSSDEDSLHVSDAGSHDIRTLDLRRGLVSTQHSGTNLTNPLAVLSGCALAPDADACHDVEEVGEIEECLVFSDLQAIYVRWSSQRRRRHRHRRHSELDLEIRSDVSNDDCRHVGEIEFVCQADKAVGLAWLEMGRIVVAAESGCHRIVSIDLESGTKTVLVGSGVAGHKDGPSSTARLNRPQSVLCVRHASNVQEVHALEANSDIYFTDLSPSVRRVVNARVETLVSTNLEFPCALAVLGHHIFFLDSACNSLFKIALERVSDIEQQQQSRDARLGANALASELRRIAANANAAVVFSAATIVSILLQRDVATKLETARGMLLDANLPRQLASMCEPAGPNMISERDFGCLLEQVQSCGWGGDLVGLKLKRALRTFFSLVADSISAMERPTSRSTRAHLQPYPDRHSRSSSRSRRS